jgi:tetratricopeptide (TPR) repeat protein
MRAILIALALGAVISPAFAQDDAPPPPQCRQDAAGQVDYQACLAAAPAGSMWRTLALINLGTDAFTAGDYASSVRYYDQARPPSGQLMYSDVTFHAFRGSAYWHVERREEALADAQIALRMLRGDATLNASPLDYMPAHVDREMMYALILPVLQTGDPAQFASALAEYQALPANDFYSIAGRAAVFDQLGRRNEALAASEQAVRLAPNDPGVQNNHCAILTNNDRAADALPFCQSAVAGAPEVAAVRDSLSDALAALGRCAEAEREIAEARRLDPASPNYARPIVCTPT